MSGRSFNSGRSFSGRDGARSYGGGPQVYGYRAGRHHHHRHSRGGRGVVIYGGGYGGYGYYGSCEYYHQQALATGSGYWWRRYQECVDE